MTGGSNEVIMPKQKTRKAISKRVKVTARGKVLRNRPGVSHLRSVKSAGRLRRFRKQVQLTGIQAKQAKQMMGE
jgi:large subunit ribosomal protein L35